MKAIKYLKKHRSLWWKIPGVLVLLAIAACSVKIMNVIQPASVNGGDVLQVEVDVNISPNADQSSKFMVAVLVPKLWKVAQNATISFTSDITTGDQPMTVIPAGTPAPNGNGLDWPTNLLTRIGNGGNLLNDYEWVAFYSNSAYGVQNNKPFNVVVHINIKTTPDNLSFKLGYCVAESTDGLSDPQYFSYTFPGCFEVHGTGDLIDFCNPQLSVIDPRTSLENDIITVNFDGGVIATHLDSVSQVYLCAKGYLTNGDSVTVCDQSEATKMTSLGLKKYQKDIWPRGYFKLSDDQHLAKLAYFFTDATGTKIVGYANSVTDPFPYTFKCQ